MDYATNQANCSNSPVAALVAYGQKQRKGFVLQNVVPETLRRHHENGTIHLHDLEYYDLTYNCIGVSVQDLVGRKPMPFSRMIRSLGREIVELTNLQSGGIGFINFDGDAACYPCDQEDEEIIEAFQELFLDLNSNSRRGSEKPYVSFNFGLDTTPAGRRISRMMLKAYLRGDSQGHPLVFPNLIFKLKSGVNYELGTPNHDLLQEAMSVTARHMVPTYFNCDTAANVAFDATTIGIMGCRTRVASNINGKEGALNRGNVAATTINLVQLAHTADGSIEHFFALLKETMIVVKAGLLHRMKTLCEKANFEDCFRKGYYLGSENQNAGQMLHNGTLSIGFIGLWDAVATLHQKSFSSADEMIPYRDEAFSIISFMRDFVDKSTEEESLNFSLLASAAEGVTGRFAESDQGRISAAQKGFYTNSFHVPVDATADCFQKCDLEAPFHALCNGGAITYIEFAEMPSGNVEAVSEIVSYAHDAGCNYIGINFPMDICSNCGYVGRIADICPICTSSEIRHLRRVSGYLSEVSSFTNGKKKELAQRVSHVQCSNGGIRDECSLLFQGGRKYPAGDYEHIGMVHKGHT